MNLVVRVIDNYTGDDPIKIAKSRGRGDVVQALPNDHQWSRLDLINSDWVVVRVDITQDEAEAMTAGEDFGFELPGARIRAFDLDLDLLIARGYKGIPTLDQAVEVKDRYTAQAKQPNVTLNDAKYDLTNASWTEVVDVSVEDFQAARKRKPAIPDPMIIG